MYIYNICIYICRLVKEKTYFENISAIAFCCTCILPTTLNNGSSKYK